MRSWLPRATLLALLAAAAIGSLAMPRPGLAAPDSGAAAATADTPPSFDWILGGRLPKTPPDVDYLGLDAFDAPASLVAAARKNGTEVWCYVSAGTIEDYRPDRKAFEELDADERRAGRPPIIGKRYPEWPDERWLNFARFERFLPLMTARMDLCRRKGFTMIEFDNLDAYQNQTGFRISAKETVAYARALAVRARARGLVPIQKNVPELSRDLAPHFGAVLFEDCVLYRFCGAAKAYVADGRLALAVEYPSAWKEAKRTFDKATVCAAGRRAGVAMIIKRLSLDRWVRRCP